MEQLLIAKNILQYRQQTNLTQEQLANILGVTKAAVSKWETGQSFPDILILPKLSTYFNISIDDLLGYSRQMSPLQISHIYKTLSELFASTTIEEALLACQRYVKDYFHCYPLLIKISGLYVNHLDLITDQQLKHNTVQDIISICNHIMKHADELAVLQETKTLLTITYLLSQQPELALEQIGTYEQQIVPDSSLRAQCYTLLGQPAKAEKSLQIGMYQFLIGLVQSLTDYLQLQLHNQAAFEETYRRAKEMVNTFNLAFLHPNTTVRLHYVVALGYLQFGQVETALNFLKQYVADIKQHLFPITLRGDNFFNLIPNWFEDLNISLHAPRDPIIVKQSLIHSLQHPAFTALHDHPDFIQLQHDLDQLSMH